MNMPNIPMTYQSDMLSIQFVFIMIWDFLYGVES